MIYRNILDMESANNIRMLTCEGALIMFIAENGPSRPRDILLNVKYSSVSTFSKLTRLSDLGITKKIQLDGSKASLYDLSCDFRSNFMK
jgi:hypothetical protein